MERKDEVEIQDATAPSATVSKTDIPSPHDIYSNGILKLIKTVNYRFEVDNVKRSTEMIEAAVKKYGAYISSSQLHLENPILENKMTIRVQSEYFHELLKEIDEQARFVNFRDVSTADVSKDFVDLESRLKTKREVESRYIEILRSKAGTVEELLEAERQIGVLHEEIEATISRINYLRDQVSFSTINLEFYQAIKEQVSSSETQSQASQFKEAFFAGWKTIIWLCVMLVYLWPLLIPATVIGIVAVRKFWK
jgi:hypothetical protein